MNTLLDCQGICSGYGDSRVLFSLDLNICEGQVVALLGRNGMGKTTTVRTIMGMLTCQQGALMFAGKNITRLPSFVRARYGLGLVPEGRQIFVNLTVQENLLVAARTGIDGADHWHLDSVLQLFPRLQERINHLGKHLSGGEQQMLAIGRALMTNPKLLILDEACEGLAPIIVQDIWRCLRTLKSQGQSILLIDRNVEEVVTVADEVFFVEKGVVVWHGGSDALRSDMTIAHRYLGV